MTKTKNIRLLILEEITNGFSVDSRIGRGGYGDVYKQSLGFPSAKAAKVQLLLDGFHKEHGKTLAALLKDLLDECLFDWINTGGLTVEKNYKRSRKKMIAFIRNNISCMQQPPTSVTGGFYVCIHIEEFIKSAKTLKQHDKILKWGQEVQSNSS
ncbi:hypothetical protein ACQJBY_000351 [Aegilops geniculata]